LGRPLTYKWATTLPPSQFTDSIINPTFVPTGPGLYTFQLTVTNDAALSSYPSTVNVLVQPAANQAPVAKAHRLEPTGEIVLGDLVVLDATGSVDPEGSPISYAWLQVAGPQVVLENPSGLRPQFTPVRPATYTFRLIVSDGVNQSRPDFVSLTVKGLVTDVTYTATLNGLSVVTGTFDLFPVVSNLAQSWYYYLEQTGGPFATISSAQPYGPLLFPNQFPFDPFTPPRYSVTPTKAGYYTFRLAATMGPTPLPGIRAYATIGVIVNDIVTPDTVPSALAAGPLQSVEAGTLVTLNAAGSQNLPATTFTGLRAYWKQVEGPPVVLSSPYATAPTFTPLAAGQYTFELTVADATAQSSPSFVVVTVTPAPSAPVASGGGGGGCGILGLEWMLILPLLWLASWLRSRTLARRRTA
jgi:PKD repeat protein